ncbi:unnamed protein product [Urochloa humidicola]
MLSLHSTHSITALIDSNFVEHSIMRKEGLILLRNLHVGRHATDGHSQVRLKIGLCCCREERCCHHPFTCPHENLECWHDTDVELSFSVSPGR